MTEEHENEGEKGHRQRKEAEEKERDIKTVTKSKMWPNTEGVRETNGEREDGKRPFTETRDRRGEGTHTHTKIK